MAANTIAENFVPQCGNTGVFCISKTRRTFR